MTVQTEKMTTQELNDLLHAHYIRPADRVDLAGAGAVYLTEVTAPGSTRRADAVHIGLWHSRGAGRIDVCELKTSRADFRRELDNPAKAEAWWPYSTTFSIVAPTADVAPPEELPPGWGLMVPGSRGRRFKTLVKPEEREPKLTIGLLLTLLKNTETTRTNALRQQRNVLNEQFREQAKRERKSLGSLSPGERRRLERLDELEQALGMELDAIPWRDQITPQVAAEGLRTFMQGQAAMDKVHRKAEIAMQSLERVAQTAADLAKEIKKTMDVQG
ncbi:hypothetical protein [Streptomyces cucumeris]|uniref:hypothetical protein n=1 Tax=Streptomyces cucumeris TaxID=2962890 RepID=UPI0020C92E49|nr:hypothetical protein [Streptomyces sp. NEAU-Y11]MCP9209626.1 hypothetical protein [Streptomyces sp. NEAU-Y11]